MVILGAILLSSFITSGDDYKKVDTSVAMAQLSKGNVSSVNFEDKEQELQLTLKKKYAGKDNKVDSNKIKTSFPARSSDRIYAQVQKQVHNGKIKSVNVKVSQDSIWVQLLISLLPVVLIVVVLVLLMSQMQGGGSKVLNFGKSKAKQLTKDMPKTTFADVTGADELGDAVRDGAGFAGSRTGEHAHRAARRQHGLALLIVEAGDQRVGV